MEFLVLKVLLFVFALLDGIYMGGIVKAMGKPKKNL